MVAQERLQDRVDALRAQAPAPASQAGAGAVARSREEAKAANVATAADAVEGERDLSARAGIAPSRRVGGRLFVLRDSVWTDLRRVDSAREVRVEAFSPAYFELLRAMPELVNAVRLGPTVLVAGTDVSVKIGSTGRSTWSDGELATIVKGLRG